MYFRPSSSRVLGEETGQAVLHLAGAKVHMPVINAAA